VCCVVLGKLDRADDGSVVLSAEVWTRHDCRRYTFSVHIHLPAVSSVGCKCRCERDGGSQMAGYSVNERVFCRTWRLPGCVSD
jgi:hypothetical protein